MFNYGYDIIQYTKQKGCSFSQAVLDYEVDLTEVSAQDILKKLDRYLDTMEQSATRALDTPLTTVGGLISGDSKRVNDYLAKGNTICGDIVVKAMALALSCSEVNASMGRICATPTAGACGIVPAAIISVGDRENISRDKRIEALLVASGIGIIIEKNASISGAKGGCQAECGSASAMACGGIIHMLGGTPEMCLEGAAICLKNIMGLVCDPVAGLVESPCAKRNASGVVNALLSADLVMAGVRSVIPFDEVVTAMDSVGRLMSPTLRETAKGGIAATKTAKAITRRFYDVV